MAYPVLACGETMTAHGSHRYMRDAKIYDCPGPATAPLPSPRLYEVRTAHGEIYRADADRVEQDVAWLILWSGDTIALKIPSPDMRALRTTDPEELNGDPVGPDCAELARAARDVLGIDMSTGTPDIAGTLLTACRELQKLRLDRNDKRRLLTDALGMDPLRDWDDIVNAARGLRRDREMDRREWLMDRRERLLADNEASSPEAAADPGSEDNVRPEVEHAKSRYGHDFDRDNFPCPTARVDKVPHDAHGWRELFNGPVRCPGYGDPGDGIAEPAPPQTAAEQVSDLERVIQRVREAVATDEPVAACPRCKGRGVVPDWSNWGAYHGEPKPKPCPDCGETEA